jgi:hypothetical protein
LEEGVVGITGREKFYRSISDHAKGLFVADYARNHLIIPKNASLSGWVPPEWSESTFRDARKFIVVTAALAITVGKKGPSRKQNSSVQIHNIRHAYSGYG